MKKIIRILGNSMGIIFNKEEQETNDLNQGDILELTITKVTKNEKTKDSEKR